MSGRTPCWSVEDGGAPPGEIKFNFPELDQTAVRILMPAQASSRETNKAMAKMKTITDVIAGILYLKDIEGKAVDKFINAEFSKAKGNGLWRRAWLSSKLTYVPDDVSSQPSAGTQKSKRPPTCG